MKNLKEKLSEKIEDVDTIIHRFEYMELYRIKNREALLRSIEIQDRIRKKTSGKFSGAKEIRKWREAR